MGVIQHRGIHPQTYLPVDAFTRHADKITQLFLRKLKPDRDTCAGHFTVLLAQVNQYSGQACRQIEKAEIAKKQASESSFEMEEE